MMMIGWRRLAAVVTASLVACAGSVRADTYTVDSLADAVDATPGNGVCATATGACTLRAAIQEANAHVGADGIALPAGTFLLSLVGSGEDAAAIGDLDVTETLTLAGAGIDVTTVNGLGADRILHGIGAAALTIRDMTLRNGVGTPGGALFQTATGAVTLDRVRIRGNLNGAVYSTGGDLTVSGCTFDDNVWPTGTGAAIFQTGTGAVSITDSTFDGNAAPGGTGGAVAAVGTGPVSLTRATFTNNLASTGGGIFLPSPSSVTIADSRFEGNKVDSAFGGLFATATGAIAITNTRVIGNLGGGAYLGAAASIQVSGSEFSDNFGPAPGGGIFIASASAVTIQSTTFRGNASTSAGGAMFTSLGGTTPVTITDVEARENAAQTGGGVFVAGASPLTLTRVRLVNNGASGGPGGGIHATAQTLSATDLTIDGNVAVTGGGAYIVTAGGYALSGSTVANNRAVGPGAAGGGLFLTTGVAGTITNCTVSGNGSDNLGGGLYNGGDTTLRHTTFASNEATMSGPAIFHAGGTATVVSTIVTGSTPPLCGGAALTDGGNDIDSSGTCGLASALVVDPQLGPLADNGGPTLTHLPAPSSPAIDAGNPVGCPATDQRGQARPTDGNGDGSSRCDIGATEFLDLCPSDPAKTLPGLCGCGVADTDTDQPNGTADCLVNGELKARIARAKTIVTGLATDTDPLETELTAIGSSLAPYVKQFKGQIQLATPKAKLDKLAKRAAKAVKKVVKAKAAKLTKAKAKATTKLDALDAAVAPQA